MAYLTADLNLMQANVGHDGGSLWVYTSSADAVAAIIAAGYIDDGLDKGMKVDDVVVIGGTDSGVGKVTVVAANGDVTMT